MKLKCWLIKSCFDFFSSFAGGTQEQCTERIFCPECYVAEPVIILLAEHFSLPLLEADYLCWEGRVSHLSCSAFMGSKCDLPVLTYLCLLEQLPVLTCKCRMRQVNRKDACSCVLVCKIIVTFKTSNNPYSFRQRTYFLPLL